MTAAADVRRATAAAARRNARSGHRRGDPAAPRRHRRRGRRQHHAHGVQPLHLRVQGLRGRHRRCERRPDLPVHGRDAGVRRRRACGAAVQRRARALRPGRICTTATSSSPTTPAPSASISTTSRCTRRSMRPGSTRADRLHGGGDALDRRRRPRHRLAVEIRHRHLPGGHPVPHRQAALARRAGARNVPDDRAQHPLSRSR